MDARTLCSWAWREHGEIERIGNCDVWCYFELFEQSTGKESWNEDIWANSVAREFINGEGRFLQLEKNNENLRKTMRIGHSLKFFISWLLRQQRSRKYHSLEIPTDWCEPTFLAIVIQTIGWESPARATLHQSRRWWTCQCPACSLTARHGAQSSAWLRIGDALFADICMCLPQIYLCRHNRNQYVHNSLISVHFTILVSHHVLADLFIHVAAASQWGDRFVFVASKCTTQYPRQMFLSPSVAEIVTRQRGDEVFA